MYGLLLIISLLFCSLIWLLYREMSNNDDSILEGYEYNVISYCDDCKNKTFGECTRCATCVWVRGYDYKTGKFFAECRKGDEHGLWKNDKENMACDSKKVLWQYSRDTFYNGPYESMIMQ